MIYQNELFSESAFIIIDFDNWFPKPINDYPSTEIEDLLKMLVRHVLLMDESIEKIIIRLYGGWYQNGNLSQTGSILVQKLSEINIFPYVNSFKELRVNGSIDIATSILKLPDLIWYDTVVQRAGLIRHQVESTSMTSTCSENPDSCPAKVFNRFARRRDKSCHVQGCEVKNKDLFKRNEQKMVDNMIACDFLTLSGEKNAKLVFVISDDTDHFPSLVLGATICDREKKLVFGFTNNQFKDKWSSLFDTIPNVQILILER